MNFPALNFAIGVRIQVTGFPFFHSFTSGMNIFSERILLVENNPDISDSIARQVLQPLGYQVKVAGDANTAIQQAAQFAPDLVISDLDLPGLSGKDLLVALNTQGSSIPLIVIAKKGQENDVIQAFRLGASDYLLWPAREAAIAASVERIIKQIRERRASQQLDQQLKQTNQELQRRVRELTTIFAIGKAVLSITDQRVLFDKLIEGAAYVAEADTGWLLLRDERTKSFLLAAHRNLPDAWAKKMGQPLDDGISSLVALSGESLTINGEPLQRFKVASLGKSALVVPVKIQQDVIGLLMVIRKTNQPFDKNMQSLLEAVADYASISMVNTRLFRALQESADSALAGEKRKLEQLRILRKEIQSQLQPVIYPVDLILTEKMGSLTEEQKQTLKTAQIALQRVLQIVNLEQPSQPLKHSASG
jgi:DNA-binding response OmpR family regulator